LAGEYISVGGRIGSVNLSTSQRWRRTRESTFALEQAQGFHDAKVLRRCIAHWVEHLHKLRALPIRALEFRAVKNKAIMQGLFEAWKSRAELRVMERMTVAKRDQRITKETLVQWKARMCVVFPVYFGAWYSLICPRQSYKAARELHERHLLRSTFTAWKSKAKRVRVRLF
jgi:hypothetical protein